MAMVDGVQTRSQQESAKMQSDFKDLEKRLEQKIEQTIADKVQDVRLEVFGVRDEVRSLRNLIESFLGKAVASPSSGQAFTGVISASPLSRPVLEVADSRVHTNEPTNDVLLSSDSNSRSYHLKCPTFDGSNF
ncbi:hypothetical protein HRI_004058000 [Hibiscus trionum]|uniref:Uncharacterized protein n=1 Tax=Hibiscus trionum TaxID=183268 RepID=A0A9W7IWI4_HIBTR|nr:hypothetical protein HRI_004058000 [Hibiscus trionum]